MVRVWVACRCNMVMPQALAQVTFPVTLQWSLTQLQEPHWLQYVCQLLEMSLTRVMRFEQSKVCLSSLLLGQAICVSHSTRVMRFEQSKVHPCFVPLVVE